MNLQDALRFNMIPTIKDCLNRYNNIDFTENDGALMRAAIASGNPEVVQLVLDYFEQHQAQPEDRSYEAVCLRNIIRAAIDCQMPFLSDNCSQKLKPIVSRYYSDNDDSDRSEFGSQGSSTYPATTTHRTNEADEVEKNDTITSSIVTVGNDAHEIVVLLGSSD